MNAQKLHPDASVRVLRKELLRLHDARLELIEAPYDPKTPPGSITRQLDQIDAEMTEIVDAIAVLESHWVGKQRGAA